MTEPTNQTNVIDLKPTRRTLTPAAQEAINNTKDYKIKYLQNRKKIVEKMKEDKEIKMAPLKKNYAMFIYQRFNLANGGGGTGSKHFKRVVNNINGGPFLFYDWLKKNNK